MVYENKNREQPQFRIRTGLMYELMLEGTGECGKGKREMGYKCI